MKTAMSTLNDIHTLQDNAFGSLEQIEFYRLLVNSIQDYAIFLLDSNGNVASWNLGAQKLKGYTASEIIGRHFSTFYTKEDLDRGKPAWELEECRNNGRVEDEYWRVRKDGTRFWANVVITALRNDAGELIGYAKVTRDLTERKTHEDELRLANAKLRRQHVELQDLNRSKDEFISLASHQLRTPASGVKQFLGLLLEGFAGQLNDQQSSFAQKAYDSNNRQISLVNDLLQVAQIDAGKVKLSKVKVDIGNLITDVIDEQRDTFIGRSQTITTELPDVPIVALADTARLRMVLENLIDNASKYTPTGGRIDVTLTATPRDYSIAVADSGVGIESEAQAKLFKKFSRIPNQLSDEVGGSGLGLYWADKIVELHGGGIEVASRQPDAGTIFTIKLPREKLNG
jgi:PAS domain S-box-containing protein